MDIFKTRCCSTGWVQISLYHLHGILALKYCWVKNYRPASWFSCIDVCTSNGRFDSVAVRLFMKKLRAFPTSGRRRPSYIVGKVQGLSFFFFRFHWTTFWIFPSPHRHIIFTAGILFVEAKGSHLSCPPY